MRLHVQIDRKQFQSEDSRQHVLSNVDFTVPEGSITCLYGPSGCGKSTCLRIIAGLDDQYEGEVRLDGQQITSPTQRIGMVVQSHVAYDWLTVMGNITFGLRYSQAGRSNSLLQRLFGGVNSELAQQESRRLAELVGLSEADLWKQPDRISGGMKQRMAFGRSLLLRPSVLLLDEPFSSLDYESRQALQEVVLRARHELGTAFVCVSHDPEEVLYLADEVIVLGGLPATVTHRFHTNQPAHRSNEYRYTESFQNAKKELRSWLNRSNGDDRDDSAKPNSVKTL